jgi:hypothetical protein
MLLQILAASPGWEQALNARPGNTEDMALIARCLHETAPERYDPRLEIQHVGEGRMVCSFEVEPGADLTYSVDPPRATTEHGVPTALSMARTCDVAMRRVCEVGRKVGAKTGPYITEDGHLLWVGAGEMLTRADKATDKIPDVVTRVALRADRPLETSQMGHMASVAEHAWKSALHKAPISSGRTLDAQTVIFDCDSRESSAHPGMFAQAAHQIAECGSPVRTSDRSGDGAKGTRAVPPLDGTTFSVYMG